jgi:hypothetical protein
MTMVGSMLPHPLSTITTVPDPLCWGDRTGRQDRWDRGWLWRWWEACCPTRSLLSPLYLIPYVEVTAAGGRTGGTEVGYDDGGKHAAPPALHDYHTQNLPFSLRHHYLQIKKHYINNAAMLSVLWICDILVRIRIIGSIPLTFGSGSCFFHQWLARCQLKIIYSKFFAYIFLKVHSHRSSTTKNQKKR